MKEILIIKRHGISEDLLSHFVAKDYNAFVVKGPLYTRHYLKEKKIEVILFYFDQIHEEEQMDLIHLFNQYPQIPVIVIKKDYLIDDHLLSLIEATQKEIDFLENKENLTHLIDSLVFVEKNEKNEKKQNQLQNLDFNKMLKHERIQIQTEKVAKEFQFKAKNMSKEGMVSNQEKDILSSL